MANETKKISLAYMEIEEPLQDIITDEYTCVVFECKINDYSERCTSHKWYKDGKSIEPSRKVKMTCDGNWFRLEMISVTAYDQGVYNIMLRNKLNETFSIANLYVRPIKDRYNNCSDVFYMNPMPKMFSILRHLRCAKVLVGDTIELEVECNLDTLEDYKWYKSNRALVPNERTIVLNDKRITTLSILCAKETDTGIYQVVCKSQYGLASSFARVTVMNTDLNTLNTCEVIPCIEESLPDEIEANEGEEVRLMCKATQDVNTTVQWAKNHINISENENIAVEYYNNTYICLRIKNSSLSDGGEYSVTVRDDITGHVDTTSCFLTINPPSKEKSCLVNLKKSLEQTATCFGSRISFTCSFDLDDPRFYYVVWYIGHFRVERTNHRFHVLNSGGNFYLIINQVEPGMAGEVICELRKALPNRKSILINSSTTTLAIVPYPVVESEKKMSRKCNGRAVFNTVPKKSQMRLKNGSNDVNGDQKLSSMNQSNGSTTLSADTKSIFIITYCRLEDDSLFFEVSDSKNEMDINNFIIYEKLDSDMTDLKSKILVVEWYDTRSRNDRKNESDDNWYLIEFGIGSNDFIEAGVSSLSMFELKDPPREQIMKFRIVPVNPPHFANESRVRITPASKELQISDKKCDLRPMEEFEFTYFKTGDLIGCGAFGSVVLVNDASGKFYAAKMLKTRTQKKRDTAVREYEMMKRLRHPKLVELFDTFVAKDIFVLVMDYLWGGELFDRIVEEEHIKEVDVVPYVRQICEALLYLHDRKIAHLDLKPENIICLSPNSRQVKIIDFGLARVLDEGHIIRAIYGTRDYVAPEVLNFEQLTLACDMWSLGVVTYMLLSGVMPFSGESWPERSANITMANYNYHESAFKEISDLAKDFVDHLLVLQPDKRMKATAALSHKWIIEGPPGGSKAGHMRRARENLRSYLANYRARWQRAGNVMIAAHRLRTHAAQQRNTIEAERKPPRVT